jgi:hypothetical protein
MSTTALVVDTAVRTVPWALKYVFANNAPEPPHNIPTIWKRIKRRLQRDARLLMTGRHFVGKTTLVDALLGKVASPGYQKPLRSVHAERSKLRSEGGDAALVVLQGQETTLRHASFDKIFGGKKFVDGWIHVVSYGYTKPENKREQRSLVHDLGLDDVPKLREHVKAEELKNFQKMTEKVRTALRNASRVGQRLPFWAIVAVTKADLFADQLDDAEGYYSPMANSPFADTMRTLQRQIGEDFFSWSAEPVCSVLESLVWNGVEICPKPKEPDSFRRELVQNLLRRIEENVGARHDQP